MRLPILPLAAVFCACGVVDDAAQPPLVDDLAPAAAPRCEASAPGLLPTLLSETGFHDPCAQPYEPRAWLWSDGAEKDRRVFLPDGAVIDDSDVDHWKLPAGTKLWKTFSREGKKIETRTLWQAEEGRWQAAAYIWNEDETDAVRSDEGVADARGTSHDVPGASACASCHGGALEPIGFSAVQLGHESAFIDVASLLDEGRLSHTPRLIPLPGDALDQKVLAGLHVNCGHCHRDGGDAEHYSMRLRLGVGSLVDVTSTPIFSTAVGVLSESSDLMRIRPGDAEQSYIAIRMAHRGDELQMPPLGSEEIDEELLAALREWINRM